MSATRGTYRAANRPKLQHSQDMIISLSDSDVALLKLIMSWRALKGSHDDAPTLAREAFQTYLISTFELISGEPWGCIYERIIRGESFVWKRDRCGNLELVRQDAA